MVPTSQKKKILAPISVLGRRWLCKWGRNAARSIMAVKLTAHLQPSTSVNPTENALPMMTHTELESNLANVPSLMHDQLLPMLGHAQQGNGPLSRQNTLPHHSPLPFHFPLLCRSPCPAHTCLCPLTHHTHLGSIIPIHPSPSLFIPTILILREPLWLPHIIALPTHFHHACKFRYFIIEY